MRTSSSSYGERRAGAVRGSIEGHGRETEVADLDNLHALAGLSVMTSVWAVSPLVALVLCGGGGGGSGGGRLVLVVVVLSK